MGLFSKIRSAGTGFVTARVLRSMGQGTFPILPRQMQWMYWNSTGIATNTGIALDAVAGVIEALDRTGACKALGIDQQCAGILETVKHLSVSVGTFFIYIGQVRGGIHLDPPAVPIRFWDRADKVAPAAPLALAAEDQPTTTAADVIKSKE